MYFRHHGKTNLEEKAITESLERAVKKRKEKRVTLEARNDILSNTTKNEPKKEEKTASPMSLNFLLNQHGLANPQNYQTQLQTLSLPIPLGLMPVQYPIPTQPQAQPSLSYLMQLQYRNMQNQNAHQS